MKGALTAVQNWKKDLDNTPAPDCLASTDATFRQGLTIYEAGLTQAIQGINGANVQQLEAATAQIGEANSLIEQATTATRSAVCP